MFDFFNRLLEFIKFNSKCNKYIFYSEISVYIEHIRIYSKIILKKEAVLLTSDPNDRFFVNKKYSQVFGSFALSS